MTNEKASSPRFGVWVFYVVFLAFLVGEGSVVGGILYVSRLVGIGQFGPEIAWALFVVFGALLAYFELKHTQVGQKMQDPILRACCWLQRRAGFMGFIVNACVAGPLGAATALKQVGHPKVVWLSTLGAVLFATVWVPLFVYVWR